MDIKSAPWAEWMEHSLKTLLEYEPEAIGMSAILPDGSFMTAYHNCSVHDKITMAGNIYADAILDAVKANARDIVQAAEEQEG